MTLRGGGVAWAGVCVCVSGLWLLSSALSEIALEFEVGEVAAAMMG